MNTLIPYFGNLHDVLNGQPCLTGLFLICASIFCGAIVGLEREARDKPAGLSTVILICVGSTIFTIASILSGIAGNGDRSRIAAQVVTGIGFLGAGAIIRDRGRVIGLTTGATIWTVAAIGVLVGVGYAAAGIGLSILVVAVLLAAKFAEGALLRPCSWEHCRIQFHPDNGRTRLRIRRILDRHRVPEKFYEIRSSQDLEVLDVRYCRRHEHHREFVDELIRFEQVRGVVEFDPSGDARQIT